MPATRHPEIRERYSCGDVTQAQLARQYGVCESRISRIVADGVRSGRRRRPSRVTGEQVAEIKQLLATGGVSQRELSARFGISQAHLSRILRRRA